MTKKAVFLFLLGVLCVGTALAGTKTQVVYNLDGTIPGFDLHVDLPKTSGGCIHVHLEPDQLQNGSYFFHAIIIWSEGGRDGYHEINGPVPSSVLKGGVGGPLKLNITYDSFTDPQGEDFAAFSGIEGTFTAYTGPGAYAEFNNGVGGATFTNEDGTSNTVFINNGTYRDQSASFDGTFYLMGTFYDLSVPGPSGGAETFVQKGRMTEITTTR